MSNVPIRIALNDVILISTHKVRFHDKIKTNKKLKNISCIYFLELSEEFLGTQKRVLLATVNELLVFEPSKFHCNMFSCRNEKNNNLGPVVQN